MTKSARIGAIVLCSVLGGSAAGCFDNDHDGGPNPPPVVELHRTDLVSDQPGVAQRTDPDLVNAWGIAYGPETSFWIADAQTQRTSIYDGQGNQVLPSIALGDEVTGTVFNPMIDEFMITANGRTAPAVFMFATTSGKILAWSDKVLPDAPVQVYDGSDEGAVYTGLAIAGTARGFRLYGANFAGGEVSVFDGNFAEMDDIGDKMHDPTLPADYSPFGIQAIDSLVYVTYAQRDPASPDEELHAPGAGAVSVYDLTGHLVGHVLSGGMLNAPWAVARAPSSFGDLGEALLIGNFGDGHITALSPMDGHVLGQLEDASGAPIVIEGLWGLVPGNSRNAGSRDALYFTAGPGDEMHGLFGTIYAEVVAGGGSSGSTTGGGGAGGGGGGRY